VFAFDTDAPPRARHHVPSSASTADRRLGDPWRYSEPRPHADDDLILILGAARSGTTWLAKILDSHPDTLYRHESDIVLGPGGMPTICRSDEVDRYQTAAKEYLATLSAARHLRTSGPPPVFKKSYRARMGWAQRAGQIFSWRALDALGIGASHDRKPIPDLISSGVARKPRVFIKSVNAAGRAALYLAAKPNLRVVYLLRHPCGQVASMLRGMELKKFSRPLRLEELLHAESAAAAGLRMETLEAMSPIEQYAWHWAIIQDKATAELEGNSRAMLVRYEDLCADPNAVSREIFAFSGLDWAESTARFLKRSTHRLSPSRYYQVTAETSEVVGRWRHELSAAQQAQIAAIVRPFHVARHYDL
jgi:hypothetical protein